MKNKLSGRVHAAPPTQQVRKSCVPRGSWTTGSALEGCLFLCISHALCSLHLERRSFLLAMSFSWVGFSSVVLVCFET